ncbi:MAG: hypothetical protein GTO45_07435 [Candidatus Aminicenantes bacterium]|nr:hypothetical protein [Candidatus Aminicenantes bacterium]NIM78669.1 hypothetical protein [Candidatus Aminicenantes bacterium]NIN17916.1 hypothetical protein [Candidatus Aminicenantes bacterium]NIN41819.1 hypothetical protein [Candidatus Aminicenantes bacterium]NIN84571.1 hypothetical protein [Candidatus Aminicenantes bacterium]
MKPVIAIIILSLALFYPLNTLTTANEGQHNSKNQKYANVFKPLDGKWKGKFYVYKNTRGQQKQNPQPHNISVKTLKQLPLKEVLVIDVEQTYTSDDPYFQRVIIKDTYTDEKGSKKTAKSKGVNKVENGRLLCIVNKPDEQVIHTGKTTGQNTIIWQRHVKEPLKIEYFKETVEDDTYTIVGWGYYGDDDPRLSPRMWFYGLYFRLK